MSEQLIEKREEVKALLRRLFRSENADLDFGIYRIMNFKRKEIEQFIEHDLIEAAEAEFREYSKVGTTDLERELERLRAEINRDFGSGTIDSEGRVVRNHDAPKIKDYLRVQEEYERAALTQEQVNDVFNHVYEFFSRYYEDGDFIPKPRYGGREKYFIPYNGEEVVLHWANQDQYYVKTWEFLKKYSFKVGRFRVNFKLVEASVEANNVKGEKKFFVLVEENPVHLDKDASEVEIRFNYRGLTEAEKGRLGTRNIQAALVAEALEKMCPLLEGSSISGILRGRGDEKSPMERHLNAYVDRNTKDYFIHKNLKGFFELEFDFYLKNEVWNLDELESLSEGSARLIAAKVKAIRGISLKIIEFLAQIEEFQKKLFEKKKFVLRTDYCMTLDQVPKDFYKEIGENERQVDEWKNLFRLDETSRGTLKTTASKRTLDVDFLKSHKSLVVDTKFFDQEFKDRLIGSLDNLNEIISGVMVKSENYQALNLILEEYRGHIKCIYIDQPYNTGSDEFLYKDNYQHSSWLSMMFDRLFLARILMSDDAVILASIDDHEAHRLRMLAETLYGLDINGTTKKQHFVGLLPTIQNLKGNNDQFGFAGTHEYTLVYAKDSEKAVLNELPLRSLEIEEAYNKEDAISRYKEGAPLKSTGRNAPRELRPNLFYPIWIGSNNEISLNEKRGFTKILPLTDGQEMSWRWSKEYLLEHLNDVIVKRGTDGEISLYRKQRLSEISESEYLQTYKPKSILYRPEYSSTAGTEELKDIMGGRVYNNPKSVSLIKDLINIGSQKDSLILDFFAGSGTTAHAAINLNRSDGGQRRYILVEMADYFDTVLKPRIQKVVYSQNWKDGKPISTDGVSHVFKYMYLEQYEDTLNNIVFRASDKTIQETLGAFRDYFLRYMLDYETRDSPTRLSVEQFKTPFNYKIKTLNGGEEKEEPVDIVETFNYLLGIRVGRIRAFKNGDRVYRVVFGERDGEQVAAIWRDMAGLDLEEDKKFIEETILTGSSPDIIYVNGDSCVKNARSIEPEFRRRMYAEDSYA